MAQDPDVTRPLPKIGTRRSRPSAPGWTPFPSSEAEGRAIVLYVEYDDRDFDVSMHRLRRAYKLLRSRTDREACEALRAHHGELVAILLDVDLPGSVLDGVLLTRILRGQVPSQALPPFARDLPRPDIPIVLLTERRGSYTEQDMVRYGGDRLLRKPVSLAALTLTLTEWHLERGAGDRPT